MTDVARLIVAAGYDGTELTRGLATSSTEIRRFGEQVHALSGPAVRTFKLPNLANDTEVAVVSLRKLGVSMQQVQTEMAALGLTYDQTAKRFRDSNGQWISQAKVMQATSVVIERLAVEHQQLAAVMAAEDAQRRNSISLFTEGARIASTEAESLRGLRTLYVQLRRELETTMLPLERRIALERELVRIRREFATVTTTSRQANLAADFTAAAIPAQRTAAALANVSSHAHGATRAFGLINAATGDFTHKGMKASGVAISFAFGLEALARSGRAGEGGIRTMLRAVSAFAALMGPKGLLVAGIAAGTAAIIDLFRKSREEMEKTRKEFVDNINQMIRASDREGLQDLQRAIQEGLPTFDLESGTIKMAGGIKQMVADSTRLVANVNLAAKIIGKVPFIPTPNADSLKATTAALAAAREQAEGLQAAIKATPQKLAEFKVTGKSDALLAIEAFKRLKEQVDLTTKSAEQLVGNTKAERDVGRELISLYDKATALQGRQKSLSSETVVELRDMVARLKEFGEVQTELLRRKFPVVPDIKVDPASLKATFEKTLFQERFFIPVTPVLGGFGRIQTIVANMEPLKVPVELEPKVDPTGLANFKGLIQQIEAAQGLLDFSRLTGDKKFQKEAEENLDRLKQRVENFARSIQFAFVAANVPLETQRKIMAEIVRLSKEMGDGADSSSDLADNIHAITTAGRGLLQVADSFGSIDENARKSIESVLALADAIAVIQTSGGSLAGMLAGAVGIVGAVSGLLQGLGLLGDSPAEQERTRLLKSNNEELARLRLELSGFTGNIGQQLSMSADLLAITSGPHSRFKEQVEALGFTMDELAVMARRSGIEIFDAAGNIIPAALKQWGQALRDAARAALQFTDSFNDQRTQMELLNRARGLPDTATQGIEDSVTLLKSLAPKLFEEFFAGVDLGDASAMRAAISKFLEAWFAGNVDESLFAGFQNKDEVIQFVNAWLDSIDKMAEAADAVTEALLGIPAGYRVERARFNATLPFVNTSIISTPWTPPVPTVPQPFPPGVVPAGGGVQTIVIQGDLNIDAQTKPIGQALDEIETYLRRKGRAKFGLGGTAVDGLN